MSKRKVKKGRFLNETQAEKNLKAKLDPKVNALRDRLDAELTTAIQEKEMDRVSTQQGIAAADTEQRIAKEMDLGLAKNIALPAQFASNAVADMTTGRRLGTIQETQTGIDVAKAVSGKEQIEDTVLGKVGAGEQQRVTVANQLPPCAEPCVGGQMFPIRLNVR